MRAIEWLKQDLALNGLICLAVAFTLLGLINHASTTQTEVKPLSESRLAKVEMNSAYSHTLARKAKIKASTKGSQGNVASQASAARPAAKAVSRQSSQSRSNASSISSNTNSVLSAVPNLSATKSTSNTSDKPKYKGIISSVAELLGLTN